ncbi:MAG: TIGR03746 family integrating conjugative element protein [Hydrogenophaga sp.]|jgi:integrating conjugative element protein (TIGR03746 family)|uniref:PFL_4703 family integrating conjugative element protein n=1 Tax=Hydrogenophaga sp. TaxID=1904254 RepID=UPI002ABC3730|nr:TIGR03746 family integrating conjugative element protein [Hydrogenophaga sp.]MDZ4175211.1 TIGR03746 family integrating conjugative element protein [Hydrogenophaga sp.]
MSTQSSLDALANERASHANTRRLFLGLTIVAVVGMALLWAKPKQIDLHINPDLRAGDQVTVANGTAPVPNPNVYSFAYYVWQQINRWQDDGGTDYGTQIYNFQSYLTPRCQAQLQGDMEARSRSGELRLRTRQITEIPGLGFQDNRVLGEGPAAWNVLLDMQVMETFRGQAVKDTYVRYPIRVVRFDVDRERNPFRLAVDCFGSNKPARIDVKDSAVNGATAAGVAPAALPGLSDQPASALVPQRSEAPAVPVASPTADAALKP